MVPHVAPRKHRDGGHLRCGELRRSTGPAEYDRPLYFVEVREGYRCGWFHQDGPRLDDAAAPTVALYARMVANTDEAEIVGRVVGVVTRLNEPWNAPAGVFPAARAD